MVRIKALNPVSRLLGIRLSFENPHRVLHLQERLSPRNCMRIWEVADRLSLSKLLNATGASTMGASPNSGPLLVLRALCASFGVQGFSEVAVVCYLHFGMMQSSGFPTPPDDLGCCGLVFWTTCCNEKNIYIYIYVCMYVCNDERHS